MTLRCRPGERRRQKNGGTGAMLPGAKAAAAPLKYKETEV